MKQVVQMRVSGKRYRFLVEKIHHSDQVIRYRVSGRNRSIVIQSNEPFFRNRGMKHRRPDWKLWEGDLREAGFLNQLIKMLEGVRYQELHPPQPGQPPNTHRRY